MAEHRITQTKATLESLGLKIAADRLSSVIEQAEARQLLLPRNSFVPDCSSRFIPEGFVIRSGTAFY